MAYSPDFWVAIATGAPVIALANTVLVTTARVSRLRLYDDYYQKHNQPVSATLSRFVWRLELPYGVGCVCYLAQLIALYDALMSLYHGSNIASPKTSIYLEFFGLSALLVISVFLGTERTLLYLRTIDVTSYVEDPSETR